jgi:DNA-binding HxlR family transcriptional regulator
MARSRTRNRRSGCPISIALEGVGDAWSLLVVRDLMFKGFHTFNEFLTAGEGIASNVLADRLQKLEAAGLLTKGKDAADGRRFVYRLTEKGIALAPVLLELVLWSAAHEDTEAPPAVVHEMRTRREDFLHQVRARWEATRDG